MKQKVMTIAAARLLLFSLAVFVTLALWMAGCKKNEAPSAETAAPPEAAKPAPPPAPPPPPPSTAFGELARVERSEKTKAEAMSLSGAFEVEEKASKGKTFVVLQFEGKAKRDFADEVFPFSSVTNSQRMLRLDENSWLTDAAGKKYKSGLLKIKGKRQLAFEVPADANGLVWHYGKKQYQLEPHPVEITESASATNPAPTK